MPSWKAPLAASLLLGTAPVLASPVAGAPGQQSIAVPRTDAGVFPGAFADAVPADLAALGSRHKPLVSSQALQSKISVKRLTRHASALFGIAEKSTPEYKHPTRVIGSAGHNGTLDYIQSIVSRLGGGGKHKGGDGYYKVWEQSFPATTGNIFNSSLVIKDTLLDDASAMSLTPPTADKKPVTAPLVLVSQQGCDASNYPAAVKGSIALIKRGNCTFGSKSELAGKAGAVAAVVYNNAAGNLSGTLGTPSPDHIATFGISDTEGLAFSRALLNGTAINATAFIDSEVLTVTTKNVLAQTVGGDPNNCVMLGGHSDSVAEGPGINDDGTGTITLLEIATQLSRFSVKNCVRFAWWAAEEEGLLGSDYYASNLTPEENLKIRVFMDYDMLASPNYVYQVYNATDDENPAGSQALRDLYIDYYTKHGLNYNLVPFDGRSDYDGFINAGIPAGGVATGAEGVKTAADVAKFGGTAGAWYDPCYHQLCDNTTNVNLEAWEVNAKLVSHSVATYAVSFAGFPNRTLDKVSTRDVSSAYKEKTKYYHGKLIL